MNSYDNTSTSMTAQQEKYLSYCLYYGFSTINVSAPSNDQSNAYIATQAMAWIIEKGIFGTASADSAASKLCATAPDSTASYTYYTTLKHQINISYNSLFIFD